MTTDLTRSERDPTVSHYQNQQGISNMRQPNPKLCPKDAQAAWKNATPRSAPTQINVCCELITPMYGGGVTAGTVDKDMPIRASALRGQLRFWWRLLNSTTYPNDLFNAESALWGGISSSGPQASQVTLNVKAKPVRSSDLISSRNNNGRLENIFDYVLILEQNQNPDLLNRGEFVLVLSFKPTVSQLQRDQVIEALRWWASFGGVGARTRRGLGAVKVTSSNPALTPVSPQEVEKKGAKMVLKLSTNNAVDAWRMAIDKLKNFRQGKGVGRKPGRGGRPGRSHWPEPDAIRRLAGHHSTNPNHAPHHPVDGYPRAAFGLPIVFHFKDNGDPADHILEPNIGDSDRMASPLILRPYFDGTKYHSLALLLPGWEECVSVPVRFDSNDEQTIYLGEAWPTDPQARQSHASQFQDLPMNNRGGDALSAFLEYFRNP